MPVRRRAVMMRLDDDLVRQLKIFMAEKDIRTYNEALYALLSIAKEFWDEWEVRKPKYFR